MLALEQLDAFLQGFAERAGNDRSSSRLRATGGELDLDVEAHRRALLSWLRAWGCRRLRVADTERSSEALAAWWAGTKASLPAATRELTTLTVHELAAAADAYGALAAAPAAWRSARNAG